MKKNFLMWLLTSIVALIGFLIAIISFFKNRRFFWRFKNEKDLISEKDEEIKIERLEKKCDCNGESCEKCSYIEIKEPVIKAHSGAFEGENGVYELKSNVADDKTFVE